MFNRSNMPSVPNPFGGRDQRGQPPPPPRGQYAPAAQQPPRYSDDTRGYPSQQPYSQKATGRSSTSSVVELAVERHKDDNYTFHNLVKVSPRDIPPSRDGSDVYILVNGRFVLSARPDPNFPQGRISFTEPHRTWAQIALTDTVRVQVYDPFADGTGQKYLASVDVEVGFASSTRRIEVPYDQDELMHNMIRNFSSQIFAPSQQLVMDHKSIPLRITVKTVQLGDLSMEKSSSAPTLSDPQARGILTQSANINFFKDQRLGQGFNLKASTRRPAANAIIQPDFKFENMGIGGLDTEFSTIFRRAFASRIFPPGIIEQLGMQHVKGVLLYGPPGTGKTLIARQIGKMLNAREPKIINGPEVLNKFVGQSEENIRKLFAEAEREYKEKGDESSLHIIIFDELDAVCKQRGSTGGGTGVGDSVVNQLLSKLDGVEQLNNILLIGMTNRMDMIDDALLRPGRLEVHVEISLPDEHGRLQILNIHTEKMRQHNRLDSDVDLVEIAALAKNFSGAELSGLVRAAGSYAFRRHTKVGTMAGISADAAEIRLTRTDFMNALEDVHSAFGVSGQALEDCLDGGLLHFSPTIPSILDQGARFAAGIRNDPSNPRIPPNRLLSVLVHGPSGSGKTALAARVALDSQFPLVKLVSAADMVGFSEMAKVSYINKVFSDAHKSQLSVIVIDNIEKIIDWIPIGPRFSHAVVGTLATSLRQKPPKGRRLLAFVTTSRFELMNQLDILDVFSRRVAVPNVAKFAEVSRVLEELGVFGGDAGRRRAMELLVERTRGAEGMGESWIEVGVGIRRVLEAVKEAEDSTPGEQAEVFADEMEQAMQESRGF